MNITLQTIYINGCWVGPTLSLASMLTAIQTPTWPPAPGTGSPDMRTANWERGGLRYEEWTGKWGSVRVLEMLHTTISMSREFCSGQSVAEHGWGSGRWGRSSEFARLSNVRNVFPGFSQVLPSDKSIEANSAVLTLEEWRITRFPADRALEASGRSKLCGCGIGPLDTLSGAFHPKASPTRQWDGNPARELRAGA